MVTVAPESGIHIFFLLCLVLLDSLFFFCTPFLPDNLKEHLSSSTDVSFDDGLEVLKIFPFLILKDLCLQSQHDAANSLLYGNKQDSKVQKTKDLESGP